MMLRLLIFMFLLPALVHAKADVNLLIQAAEGGIAEAQYDLAVLYERGEGGVKQSAVKARQWYEAAAKNGHAGAKTWLSVAARKAVAEKTAKAKRIAEEENRQESAREQDRQRAEETRKAKAGRAEKAEAGRAEKARVKAKWQNVSDVPGCHKWHKECMSKCEYDCNLFGFCNSDTACVMNCYDEANECNWSKISAE